MAGDWIPVDTDLPYKPEVARIAEAIRRSPDEVVGILVRFWSWAQAHCSHGVFPGYTPDTLAKVARVSTSFLRAMVSVGWLDVTETGTVIPKFDKWLSDAAKRRLLTRERVAAFRSKQRKEVSSECNAECNARVTPMKRKCNPNNNDDVDDDVKGEKGGVGEKGGGPPCNGASVTAGVTSPLPPDEAVWPIFRTYAVAWGPRGPTSKRDRVLLWRVCALAAGGQTWATTALESLDNGKPTRPGAYLQKLTLELGPREPHVSLMLAEIPVPAEIGRGPPPSKPREAPVEERPLTPEEGRELVQELFAAVSRNPVRRP
jgi:hypothetical protein